MKAILIPTDFSESSFNAAVYAAKLSNMIHVSTLIIYHSSTIPSRATELPLLHEHTRELLESFKGKLASYIKRGISIDIHSDEFPLLAGIEMLAKRQSVDLIVMSTTGKSKVERVILGSNTITIAKECSIPVLLIPKAANFEEIKKLALASDLKDVDVSTPANFLKWFIEPLNAQLVIVNISTSEEPDSHTNIELSALKRMFEKEQPEYHHIRVSNVVNGLMNFAVSENIQLIAVAPKKHGFFDIFHHSLTRDIAFHTYVPVLIVRNNNKKADF